MTATGQPLPYATMRFYFDVQDDGRPIQDPLGVELASREAARLYALEALAEMTRNEIPDGNRLDLTCDVRDETGCVIFVATLSLVARWVAHGVPPAPA